MNLQRHQKGFTLLEILIAMGIIGVIIMVMGSVFIGATKLWLSSNVHMNAQQRARDVLSGNPHLKVLTRAENVEWHGILNELQDMVILLPSTVGGTPTFTADTIRFATEAYIQYGTNTLCNSTPTTTGTISDIQIGTSGAISDICIIHGRDGKFRSAAGGDDRLYGHIIRGPDGTSSTVKRSIPIVTDDVVRDNLGTESILIAPGNDNLLQSVLGDSTGDGVPDGTSPDEYIVGDVISYSFNPTARTITRMVNDNSATSIIIGKDISVFSLSYSDVAGLPVTYPGVVKQIGGTITVSIPKKSGAEYTNYTLPFNVSPRKLNAAFGGM